MANELIEAPTQGKLADWVGTDRVITKVEDALGGIMDPRQFIEQMSVFFQRPEVARCSDKSKYTALMTCAAMGLLPSLDQVKLIPYKDELKAMPQWQGIKALMERNGDILEVTAHLVHKDDKFLYENGDLYHSFNPLAPDRSITGPKDILGGYCKIVYTNGRPPKYHFTPVAHITKCQNCAQTQNVWSKWYEQMAVKTLYRDAYARRAVAMDPLVNARLKTCFDIEDLNLGNNPNPPATLLESHKQQARQAREDEKPTDKESLPVEPEEPPESLTTVLDEYIQRVEAATDLDILAAIEGDMVEEAGLEPLDIAIIHKAMDKRAPSFKKPAKRKSNPASESEPPSGLFDGEPV